MEKISFVLMLLLLSACKEKESIVACSLYNNENTLTYTFESDYDVISSITLKRSFKIPYNILLNEKLITDLNKQLDENYYFEDDFLIHVQSIPVDKKYSLAKTVILLKENKYACQ